MHVQTNPAMVGRGPESILANVNSLRYMTLAYSSRGGSDKYSILKKKVWSFHIVVLGW